MPHVAGGSAASAQAGSVRWDRRGVRPACRTCRTGSRRRRALQPARPRSHDRRCPSGSGWGEAPAARTFGCSLLRQLKQEAPSSHGSVIRRRRDGPWPVNTRLASLEGRRTQHPACRARGPAGRARKSLLPKAAPGQAREGRPARVRTAPSGAVVARVATPTQVATPARRWQDRRVTTHRGSGGVTRTGWRRATSPAPAWDQEIGGCARGPFWLQKSTSGAGSMPSGTGLAPTPHARESHPGAVLPRQRGFCLAQRGEEASWPPRGSNAAGPVESRRVHAAAHLRVRTAAMSCGRAGLPVKRGPGDARATAPVNLGDAKGAIVDGRRPGPAKPAAFDEAAGGGGPGGTESAVTGHFLAKWSWPEHRVATEGVRGHLTSSDRGRQSRGREARRGGAVDRCSARNAQCPLHHDRPGLRLRARAGNVSWAMAEAGGSPSSDALPVGLPEV